MDYAIFLLHKFTEFRLQGLEPEEAMVQASVKSVGSIFSSGITTVIGFAALILMRFKIGPDMPSATFEQGYKDISTYQQFSGVRMNKMLLIKLNINY